MRATKPETPIEVKQLAALITVRTARLGSILRESFRVATAGSLLRIAMGEMGGYWVARIATRTPQSYCIEPPIMIKS